MSEQLGFLGLGAIGSVLAGALVEAGHHVTVFDPRPEAIEQLVAQGAAAASSVAEVGECAATVFASLPTPDVVREVAIGDRGVLAGSAVRTLVDLSTTGSEVSRAIAERFALAGLGFLDAPVSGGVAGAREHRLAVMAAGDHGLFERVRPLLEVFGKTIIYVGTEPGQGQIAKLLNNLLSATALAITSEALTLGAQAGLEPATLLDVFNASSGRNTATADKFPKHVVTGTFAAGFRLHLMAKDVELCLAEADARRTPFLLGEVVRQLWRMAAAQSEEDADVTEVVRMFEQWSGTTVHPEASHVDG